MALRFMDGFDHYATADFGLKWVANGSAVIVTTPTRFNTGQALNINSITVTKIIDAQPTWIIGFAIKLPSISTGNIVLLRGAGNANFIAYLQLVAGGKLAIISQNSSGTTTLATGTTTLAANVWYYVEWKYTCAATAGAVASALYIAGILECQQVAGSGGSTTNGTTIDTIQLSGPYFGNFYFDDVYMLDGTGSTNNTFLGDVRIESIRPNGVGFQTDFTRNTGATNWGAVSEANEDGDTTYVSSATANQIDSYAMGDLLTTPPTIFAVQTIITARKDDAGAKTFQSFVRISSTNYFGSTQSVQDSYNFFTRVMETSPATGVAWTASEVNGLESGIKLIS